MGRGCLSWHRKGDCSSRPPEASCVCRFLAPVTFKGTLAHHVVLNPLVSEALPSGLGIQS